MKPRTYNFGSRNSIALGFCLIALIVLACSDWKVSSNSVQSGGRGTIQPSAPTANSVCLTGQTLLPGDPTFPRPNTLLAAGGAFSTGCSVDSTGLLLAGGAAQHYKAFAFNVSGCTSPLLTVTTGGSGTCASACSATATNFDSVVFIYQKDGGAPGAFGDPVFNPADPTGIVDSNGPHLRSANNNGCGDDGIITNLPICLGVFVVVVSGNASTDVGTITLTVTVTGTGTCNLVSAPTLAQLDFFSANGYADGTSLVWKTGREVDNLGFNIYREDRGKRTRVNDQILAGSALLTGPGTDLKAGSSYSWTDSSRAGANTQYWLEDLGLDGQSTWHGPFNVDRSLSSDYLPRPAKGCAQLLSKVGTQASQNSQTFPLPRFTNSPQMMIAGLNGQPDLAKRPAMKLAVEQEGWYRVSQSELAAAGFDTRTDPRMLQLFVDGQEQAISVLGEQDGRFDPSDAVEFYGVGLDSAYTNSRTYWLAAGSQPGLRIEKVKGKGSRAAPSSFPYTVERRERSIYFSALRNGDSENFFGAVIARDSVDQSINVQHLDNAGSGAELELALQGVTALSHRVGVELNGAEVGAMGFDGQAEGITRIPLGRSALKEGQNIVRLTPFGGESDVSLVRYIRITYPHTYTADDDALRFNLSGKQQVSIVGFSSPAIRVIDVTDPGAVREVTARVEARNGSYSVTVSAPKGGGDGLLLAFSDNKASGPGAMTLNRPSNLREPASGADLVIITHRDFLDSVAPLKAAREAQGFSVAVVDVEDAYDEFGFGQKSPQAVKDFLAFARSNWQTPPRYALLIGDASLDPKGYLGFGDSDFVPTKLIDTTVMETASDDWLVDFDNNGSADMAIGRLPVRTPDETAAMIAKIIGYDQSEPVNRILLISDSGEDYDFEALNTELKNALPPNILAGEINRGRMPAANAWSELVVGLDQGQKIVNYIGHGNVDQWRGNLLTSESARTLTNSRHLPLFVMMTCLNGYFQDVSLESLAEALMKTEHGGAVAVWASSGMTAPTGQTELNQQILSLVLGSGSGSSTLGEATVQAKSAVSDTDVRRTWILFGDPTMRLR